MSKNGVTEIIVKVSGDDRTLTQHFLCYDVIAISHDDPKVKDMVDMVIGAFKGNVESVTVKTKTEW
ncbi:MAG: hypothetical protein KGZ39_00395 [Simkania sp.]|nr:hypothetical protein [Simkania sp.]